MQKKEALGLGRDNKEFNLFMSSYNRHGIIAAHNTNDRFFITKAIAESISTNGVSVLVTNSTGAMTGFCEKGISNDKFESLLIKNSIESFDFNHYPTCFWDLLGKNGHPIRTTVSEIGPLLLSNLLGLTEAQAALLYKIYHIADKEGLLLLDLKDIIAVVNHLETIDDSKIFSRKVIKALSHKLAIAQLSKANNFFGEPAFRISNLLDSTFNKGTINILNTNNLITLPELYITLILWLLAELTEKLPTLGSNKTPRLVFIIDNTDYFFNNMGKDLTTKVAQMLKSLTLKGVGIFFTVEDINSVPKSIQGELYNNFIGFYPSYITTDNKCLKNINELLKGEKSFELEGFLGSLCYGEAVISTLCDTERYSIIDKVSLYPPKSLLGAASQNSIKNIITNSKYYGFYDVILDANSAYERLNKMSTIQKQEMGNAQQAPKKESSRKKQLRKTDSVLEKALKSAATSLGRQFGNTIARGLLEMLKIDKSDVDKSNNEELDEK